MPTTSTVAFSALIEETFDLLYQQAERPKEVAVGTNALTDGNDTALTLAFGDEDSVHVGDRLETAAGETLLVTAKTEDQTPVFTVRRGVYNTSSLAAAVAAGAYLIVEPSWPREQVKRTIRRFIGGVLPTVVPLRETSSGSLVADKQWIKLDADVSEIFEVYWINDLGRPITIDQWRFDPDVATAVADTGKILEMPPGLDEDTTFYIVNGKEYTVPDGESDNVTLMLGSQDLVSLYAAAFLTTGREVSRLAVDRIEEWNQELANRQGLNVRLIRELWAQYYRRVDEVKRIQYRPKRRPFIRRRK